MDSLGYLGHAGRQIYLCCSIIVMSQMCGVDRPLRLWSSTFDRRWICNFYVAPRSVGKFIFYRFSLSRK